MTATVPLRRRCCGLLLMALGLSGCASWLDPGHNQDRPVLYAPNPHIIPSPDWPYVERSVLIALPGASRMLADTRILVRPDADEIQVLRGAAWVHPPPEMLQTALLRVLEDSARLRAVARQGTAISADQTLILELRRFEADYRHGTPPRIEIAVSAKLVRHQDLRLLAARTFTHTEPATATSTEAVVGAFSDGLGQVVRQLAEWVLTSGQLSSGEAPEHAQLQVNE